jgi:DNA-binding CsgD family transcriptional regulator/tetratricopeptide (TPR) repeat protein
MPGSTASIGNFVGRAREIEVLDKALSEAQDGQGRLVMLLGEPGIGKTRLAQVFSATAAENGAQVFWGACHEEPGAPAFWPWVQVLRAMAQSLDDRRLAEFLGSGADAITGLSAEIAGRVSRREEPKRMEDEDAARFRLYDAVTGFIQRLAKATPPLVIILDNLHWADASSLRLLEFLAAEISNTRLLVIATYRDVGLSRRHPLSEALGAITPLACFRRCQLQRLDKAAVGAFMHAEMQALPRPELVRAVHERTEGNPLFLTEVMRFFAQEGILERTAAGAPLGAVMLHRMPEGVRDVIGRRLNRLSATSNEVLALASVIGRNFGFALLARLIEGQSEAQALDALEEAISARIIEAAGPDQRRYRFTHALIREALYEELATPRRASLHLRVGEALEALHPLDLEAHLPQIAHHFCEAAHIGDARRAAAYATRAAEQAAGLLAHEEAARFYELALQSLDMEESPEPRRRCRLLLALGDMQIRAGRSRPAMSTFEAAAAAAEDAGVPEDLAAAALGFEEARWRPGLLSDKAIPLLQKARRLLPDDAEALHCKLLAGIASAMSFTTERSEALPIARKSLAMARRLGDPQVLGHALTLAIFALRSRPETLEEQTSLAEDLLTLGEEIDDSKIVMHALAWLVIILFHLGEGDALRRRLAEFERRAEASRQPHFRTGVRWTRAALLLAEGDFAGAERTARKAVELGRLARLASVEGIFAMQMFTSCWLRGRLEAVAPLVKTFVDQSSKAATWRPGLALIYAELGRLDEAHQEFEALAVENFAAIPEDELWPTCMAYMALVCAALGDRRRAEVIYAKLRPYGTRGIVAGAASAYYGAGAYYLGLLATTRRRWSAAEDHFKDALDMHRRMGAKPWCALTRFAQAAMLLARGSRGDGEAAAALLQETRGSAEALGMAGLAARCAQRQGELTQEVATDRLTAREIEVLQLVAIGRSNKDIATALGISINTVATHVRRILAKTGTANRTEAAAYAMSQGLMAD